MRDTYDWEAFELKRKLFQASPHCTYCHTRLEVWEGTLDHVIPRAKGGGNGPDNLVLACFPCNQAKQDMLPLNFFVRKYAHRLQESA